MKGHSVSTGKIAAFLIFFGIVILMALLGDTNGKAADVSFGIINMIKLFSVGIIAAATMVVPGVSGSMMLMLLGYYDTNDRAAEEAAQFTGTERYDTLAELVSASRLIFITTPDGIILRVWEQIRHLPLAQKIICHCSGALSSDSFSGIEDTRAACLSIHPMLPFSNRFSSYEQLEKAFFTVEGDSSATQVVSAMFEGFGNRVCSIRAEDKPRYHAAASILSNQVVAVLDVDMRCLNNADFPERKPLWRQRRWYGRI